ncbi:hypothetical protein NDU88_005788 [Pleurodeles waltl]|uniref:Uncharacterized protein n=1 Tax=Pleurodeles waltl TaxID=8319 RepID=A0AAV7RJM7_PLEWA|nr:hypothetical protein NDU88_005788 [Pleurodeles waltl]
MPIDSSYAGSSGTTACSSDRQVSQHPLRKASAEKRSGLIAHEAFRGEWELAGRRYRGGPCPLLASTRLRREPLL